jgi:LPXTG-site transpeptidase (sortase) family protein
MADGTLDTPATPPASTGSPTPGETLPSPVDGVEPGKPVERHKGRKVRKRRSWVWWLANLMIVAGVLCIPGYFLGSCAYTALQQKGLREQLAETSPQVAEAVATSINKADFVPIETSTTTTLAPSATEEEVSAVEAAIAAAKMRRDSELARFKTAADVFAASVGGQTHEPIGKIIIPSIGVDVVMVEGTSKGDLKEGPGHWEETPFPGQGGNFVVSGHRTTYGAPFFKLNEVEVGDEIQLILPYVVAIYRVTKTFIVYPDEVETVRSVGREQVSLAACHPIYSAKQRIVVQGDLISFKLIDSKG